ncbi:TetR/AcrR family transcriptional regulator [Nocardioides acrostichi]|uniref:TetR/AcrR family transcriptional regulator n=1 Tax=Nocardioides acrostichi TaxID=2784339 RepID=A0A930V0Z0_9ACTN|nr:TetR/AcrR family transcriptional regulator [Nocardioides acrostichi]MBF4163706.1 TetR/AcrR family transcriptional regulator [Nocardioides acrostichi]
MPTPPVTAKGEATRQRILDAATSEFAAYGLAGARVDRIAEVAHTNKGQIYAYFGSKEALFDAVFFASMHQIMADAPIDPDDLADWAVRLYDDYLDHPERVRLATWHRLERRPHGLLVDEDDRLDSAKLRGIAEAQQAGKVRPALPFDVMALVIAMSCTWSPTSTVYTATASEDAATHAARRDLLRTAVSAAVAGPARAGSVG